LSRGSPGDENLTGENKLDVEAPHREVTHENGCCDYDTWCPLNCPCTDCEEENCPEECPHPEWNCAKYDVVEIDKFRRKQDEIASKNSKKPSDDDDDDFDGNDFTGLTLFRIG